MSKFKVNKSKCAGCGACLKFCPYGAIKIGEDGKAFIDEENVKIVVNAKKFVLLML